MTAPPPSLRHRLPGDPSPEEQVARMLRVDHAGEHGAVRIYEGQLAVLGHKPAGDVIRRMAAQEERHLATFDRMLPARQVRPTLLGPLWHAAGFALGAATALLGERAAMACTVAVEEVIDEHYRAQAEALGAEEPELKNVIEDFRRDEAAHRDEGLAHGAEQTPGYEVLSATIKSASRLAIWLSTRL
jgi:ubiquinone biosynthesis monooxygenase Coq7